jgi:phosphatidylglycerophosphate synthase
MANGRSRFLGVVSVVALVGLALALRTPLGLGDWYVIKSAVAFGVVMLIALSLIGRSHPFAHFGPANQITTLRALLTSLVAGGIGEPATPTIQAALVSIGTLAALLDGVDGWMARRSRMESPFGARFDMEVDALLILALSILAWQHDKAGWWVLVSGLLRYAFVAAGWQWPWLGQPLPGSRRRQSICVVQIVSLLIVVSPIVTRPASSVLAAAALAVLSLSFLVDILWLWRRVHGAPGGFSREPAEGT